MIQLTIDELALRHPLVLSSAETLAHRSGAPVTVALTPAGADLFLGALPLGARSVVVSPRAPG